jgi:Ni,Fe-hydrogenase III small subunit
MFGRSLWVYHANSGGCNGCDIEVLNALTPYYDAERFGIKFAIGSCAGGGGIWFDSYSVLGPVEKVVPVNFYVPGCPPRPEAIIYGVAVAVGLVDKKTAPVKFKQAEFPIPRYHPDQLKGQGELVVYEKLEKI